MRIAFYWANVCRFIHSHTRQRTKNKKRRKNKIPRKIFFGVVLYYLSIYLYLYLCVTILKTHAIANFRFSLISVIAVYFKTFICAFCMCDDTHVLLNGSDQNNVTELKKSAIFEKKSVDSKRKSTVARFHNLKFNWNWLDLVEKILWICDATKPRKLTQQRNF